MLKDYELDYIAPPKRERIAPHSSMSSSAFPWDSRELKHNIIRLQNNLVSFLQMSSLGAASSTDILLSLPMLLSESSSESLAGWCFGVLVCTRCTFPTDRCDLTNFTLPPLLSLS